MLQHEPHHVSPPGAQRHSYPDLACALSNRVRHHAIQSDRRQDQRQDSAGAQQRSLPSFAAQRILHSFAQRLDVEHRKARVYLLHLIAQRGDEPFRVGRRSHVQVDLRGVLLLERYVHKGPARFGQAVVFTVCDEPYHFPKILISEKLQPLAQDVLPWPEPGSHRLVDDHHLWRLLIVVFVEAAAAQQWNAERIKETGRDVVGLHKHSASAGRRLLAFDEDASLEPSAERAVASYGRVQHAWHGANSLDCETMKVSALSFSVTFPAEVERH